MKTKAGLPLVVVVLLALGCEVPELEVPRPPAPPVEQQAAVEEPVEEPAEEEEVVSGVEPVTSVPRPFTAKDPARGKKSRAQGGIAAATAGARFYAEYENLRINIVHALDLYWGMEGEYPKSHEEFMEKIIKFNQLTLPELDPGVEYIYDPNDHVLKIYRPAGDAASENTGEPLQGG